ncbi:MAG: YggS family pyridoxal phosphate-dependent enzyme [Candidatus Omnitrophota bacterium]
MSEIRENIKRVQESIAYAAERCGRRADDILLMAVSKTCASEKVADAYGDGLRVFGENRVQEAEGKIFALHELDIQWHLIGHLQTNKVKKALALFHLIHSVDSPKLVEALQKEADKLDRTADILLEVNLGGEETKSGADVKEFENLIQAVQSAPRVHCRGLMTIPPFLDDPEDARPFFRELRELAEKYAEDFLYPGVRMELSMGMTHDFPVAIEEGATIVRVGTAIFGARFYP